MRLPLAPALAAIAAVALLAPATAVAGVYPAPSDPGGKPQPRAGKPATLSVCKQSKCRYRTIQAAVNAAKSGDKIRVADGTYREGVKVNGHAKDKISFVGNARRPAKVFINAAGKQNGIIVSNANGVKIDGFSTKGYKANGFFIVNADGYTINHVIARGPGGYGVFAFNSLGGTMKNSEAYYNNDSGFYIGQTPKQTKPKRSIVDNIVAWGNVLGWSGTNMRYVTIKNSDFYNNGLGIVPNTLTSEKFPPPQDNTISNNRVFWNNFNYFVGAPFKLRPGATGDVPYPVGTGILLYGSHNTRVENNEIFGNFLMGFGEVPAVLFDKSKCNPTLGCEDDPVALVGNQVKNNTFGKGGADLNARDMLFDGSGTGNCFEGNKTVSPNVPADNKTFVPCGQQSPEDPAALQEGLGWAIDSTTDHEKYWIRHPHQAIKGITPLERFRK